MGGRGTREPLAVIQALWRQKTPLREERAEELRSFLESLGLTLGDYYKHEVSLEALFLGSNAENYDLLAELVETALSMHRQARLEWWAGDPSSIPDARSSNAYQHTRAHVLAHAERVFAALMRSAPVYDSRSYGHMLWDTLLPALGGYIGALLYNQNNVAFEASPVTTWLEIQVGKDLCRMIGFDGTGKIEPWGHITCGGSVANIEALWAARNARYFGVSLREALRREPVLEHWRDLKIPGTNDMVLEADDWQLLNLPLDDVLALRTALFSSKAPPEVEREKVELALKRHSVQHLGLLELHRRLLRNGPTPVTIVPATRHYSWPKAAGLLGLGEHRLWNLGVDPLGRLDIGELRQRLETCLAEKIPVVAVVAVIGTTQISAVDPLDEILAVREEFRDRGLDFAVLCDAAWGGYFASMLELRQDLRQRERPTWPLGDHARTQLESLRRADTVTLDPHKSGFVPYPAGSLCYRNGDTRFLISMEAPVIKHGEAEPSVGIYGVEGSKPGAAPTAVFLAHKTLPANETGYGKLLGRAAWAAKRLYCHLATMDVGAPFLLEPIAPLPSSTSKERIRDLFVGPEEAFKTDSQILDLLRADPEALGLFEKLGPDLLIVGYAFNEMGNVDPARLNEINQHIFEEGSVGPGESQKTPEDRYLPLIITCGALDPTFAGALVRDLRGRLGVEHDPDIPQTILITTLMNPWTTDAPSRGGGSLLDAFARRLRSVATTVIERGDWSQ